MSLRLRWYERKQSWVIPIKVIERLENMQQLINQLIVRWDKYYSIQKVDFDTLWKVQK